MDNYCFALWLQRGAHKTKVAQPAASLVMDAVEHATLHSRGEGFSSTSTWLLVLNLLKSNLASSRAAASKPRLTYR